MPIPEIMSPETVIDPRYFPRARSLFFQARCRRGGVDDRIELTVRWLTDRDNPEYDEPPPERDHIVLGGSIDLP